MFALLPPAAVLARFPLLAQSRLFSRKPKVKPASPLPFVYLGTDTDKAGAKGIYLSRFNPATGQLSPPMLVAQTLRPSFLATTLIGKSRFLYAANEGSTEQTSAVTTFLVDPANGALRQVGVVPAGGASPCYISVDGTGSAAFVANYTGSSVSSFKVNADGTLSQPVNRIDFRQKLFGDHGPNAARQDAPHPHSATISPDNRFLIVNDLGNDDIVTFPIHPQTGSLGAPHVNDSRVDGSGPRHIAFHPNQRWVYGVDELSSKIEHYLWNATHAAGSMEPVALLTSAGGSVSTLDSGYRGANTAAEIVVTPDGNYVIVSNRGENSLVVFHLDPLTGALGFLQRISCGGAKPRQFTLDSSGRWLVCGNEDSASVTVFARDEHTGYLSGPVQTLALQSPLMALFV